MLVRPDLRGSVLAPSTAPGPSDTTAVVARTSDPARRSSPRRRARWLHPVAWWIWAVGVSVAASRTTNPVVLALLGVAVVNVAVARRRPGPAGRAVRVFVQFGLVVLAFRMLLTVVFSAEGNGRIVLRLPEPTLPAWLEGVGLGGPVTSDQLLAAFYGGCRLAVVLVCFGAVNAVSSGYRLVRSLPAALYETGVAVGVAVTVAPQLVAEVARVRAARRLRGRPGGVRGVAGTVLPVLEAALERAVDMAASMDVRGYGRRGGTSAAHRRVAALLLSTATVLLLVGLYGRLSPGVSPLLAGPALVAGAIMLVVALWWGSRGHGRTRLAVDPWGAPEWCVALSGVAAALLVGLGPADGLHPPVAPFAWPAPTVGAVLAVAAALLPILAAPPVPGAVPSEGGRP